MRGHKYHARKTEVDGIFFPSAGQARRYQELKLLVAAREICNLELEVPFQIVINQMKICTYRADFVYRERGMRIVEDFKGMETPVFKLKRKLLRAVLGIELRVTN